MDKGYKDIPLHPSRIVNIKMSGETVEQSEFSYTSGETFKLVQMLLHSSSATCFLISQ